MYLALYQAGKILVKHWFMGICLFRKIKTEMFHGEGYNNILAQPRFLNLPAGFLPAHAVRLLGATVSSAPAPGQHTKCTALELATSRHPDTCPAGSERPKQQIRKMTSPAALARAMGVSERPERSRLCGDDELYWFAQERSNFTKLMEEEAAANGYQTLLSQTKEPSKDASSL